MPLQVRERARAYASARARVHRRRVQTAPGVSMRATTQMDTNAPMGYQSARMDAPLARSATTNGSLRPGSQACASPTS